MSYAAKYARPLWPFATRSHGKTLRGDKRSYQMDPPIPTRRCASGARSRTGGHGDGEAGHALFDIVAASRKTLAADLRVSSLGEYAMLTAAAQNGWLDGDRAMMESLLASSARGLRAC